jgi:hypothetical protein
MGSRGAALHHGDLRRSQTVTSDAVTWQVRYRIARMDRVVGYRSPEQAIETACRLIDDGYGC